MKIKQTMILLLTLLPLNAFALTDEEKGLNIAIDAEKSDTGWKDQSSKVVMTLRNRHGDESIRKNRMKILEVNGDGDKSLIIFDTPADVKGTAFLSHTHATKADNQWLYLPALKRVKRISSSNKSGPFMGSEFAYEDLSSQEVEKYKYKYLRDEKVDEFDTYVMERFPQYRNSGYKRQIVWMDKEMLRVVKTEFYDRKNSLLKTLTYHEFKQYLSKYWRSNRMEMINHQTGKSTTLAWQDYKFQSGFGKRNFDKNSLKRAR